MVVGMLVVIAILLSCGNGSEILLYLISILVGYISDLLHQQLLGSAKHEYTTSAEVHGM
jgi:hypothetical protein